MPEDFSTEDFRQAGLKTLDVLDYLEDEDVQQAAKDTKASLELLVIHLRALGCDNRTAASIVFSVLMAPYLPE